MSIKRRMYGYYKPGPTQTTNLRINPLLKQRIAIVERVDVLGFHLLDHQRFPGFVLSIPAGLEDSIIQVFDPPWNKLKSLRAPMNP